MHTRIKHDSPLDMLRFPIGPGAQFSTDASATGYTDVFPFVSYDERYTIDVLGSGKLKLLQGFTLDVLLIRARESVYQAWNPWLGEVKTTAFLFMAECYGTVARLIAKDDPGSALQAVEVKEMWRLAAP